MGKNKSVSFKIFLILFAVFFITVSGNIDSIDGNTSIFLARKIVLERKTYFEKHENSLDMPVYLDKDNNRYIPIYNFGYALAIAPGIVISYLLRRAVGASLPDYPFNPDIIVILYDNLLNGILITLSGVLIYKILIYLNPKLRKSRYLPYLIPLAVLSTNLFVQGHHSFAHPIFTTLFLLSLYCFLKYTNTANSRHLLYFSLFFGFTASVYNATFVLFIPALLTYYLTSNKKLTIGLILAFFPAVVVQMSWNFIRFGSILKTGYTEIGMTIFDFNILHMIQKMYGMTFAPNKGFFIYSPLIIIPVFYTLYLFLKRKLNPYGNFAVFFIVLFSTYLFNYSSATIWHGDSAYGPRYLTPLIPVGIVLFFLYYDILRSAILRTLIIAFMFIGVLIQLPGILIPPFALPFLSPPGCRESPQIYFYDYKCFPLKVGWSHLLRRRIKETIMVTAAEKPDTSEILLAYPNPPKPFHTIYSDPLFDKFSRYKTTRYIPEKKMIGDIYSFVLDVWWVKRRLYKNIGII